MTKARSKRSTSREISYNFAILRVVPHVYTGAFAPVGVIVHARTKEFLAMRAIKDRDELARRAAGVDVDLLMKYLASCESICRGEENAGPIALAPPSERFHWLTSPRSDVIQCGPVHEGLSSDPAAALDTLYTGMVQRPGVR